MRSTALPHPPLSGSLDTDFGVYVQIKNARLTNTYGGGETVHDIGWVDLSEYEDWNALESYLIDMGYNPTAHNIYVADLEGICLPLFQESPGGFDRSDMELVCSVRDFIRENSSGVSVFVRAYISDNHGEWDPAVFEAEYEGYFETKKDFVDYLIYKTGVLSLHELPSEVINFLDYDKIYRHYMNQMFWEDEGHYFRR